MRVRVRALPAVLVMLVYTVSLRIRMVPVAAATLHRHEVRAGRRGGDGAWSHQTAGAAARCTTATLASGRRAS